MKILLAEDDRRLGKVLHHMLIKQGHQVVHVERAFCPAFFFFSFSM